MSVHDPFNPETLSRALVRLREDVHLSQRKLGQLAGVSNTAISDLEAGLAPPPHPTMLWKLARGLSTSGSGTVDDGDVRRRFDALMDAAGYGPRRPDASGADDGLLAQVRANLAQFDRDTQDELIALWLHNLRLMQDARRRRDD